MRTLRLDQARRAALGAQGFTRPRPTSIDVRHLRRVLATTGVVQLDSVNVSARAHYLPFFSRLGGYDRQRLDDLLWRSDEAFEYWGHEASVLPMSLHPVLRHRMDGQHPWKGVQRLANEQPGYLEDVLAQVRDDGPVTVSQLRDPGPRGGSYWGWNRGRVALEWLYTAGHLAIAQRDAQFTRHYDLTDRVIPKRVLTQPALPEQEAHDALVEHAARAHGVGTVADLADYYRLGIRDTRATVDRLVAADRLHEVAVTGWDQPAYMHPDAVVPRQVRASALLSPFDPVVWNRPRLERLFDFHYRIEIYVPEADRVHGYYVLPFLLDDRLVARVDLKAHRQRGALEVKGAFSEDGADRSRVARALAVELHHFAQWSGLTSVEVAVRGDLAPDLARAL